MVAAIIRNFVPSFMLFLTPCGRSSGSRKDFCKTTDAGVLTSRQK